MKAQVEDVILRFESGSTSSEAACAEIHRLTGKEIDRFTLCSYSASESLDEFVRRLCQPPIEDWREINDARAIGLIEQIRQDVADDAVFERNAEALEKRYRKPGGTVSDLIFGRHSLTPREILAELKKDTVIYL